MDNIHHSFLVSLLVVTKITMATAEDCYNTPTSEGVITLPHLHYACAGLSKDQGTEDLGKDYVQCVHGNVYTRPCPAGLRWDNSINTCNFAKSGNCGSSDRNLDYPVVTEKTTRRPGTTIEGPRTPTRGWKPDRTSTSDNRETISSSGTGASEFTTQKTSEKVVESGYCFNVDTSEGPRTLRSGQRACASLDRDEKESNLGRKFVTCVTGNVYTQDCQTGLRFDTATGLCNWPDFSTCEFETEIPISDKPDSPRPTTLSSSRRPPTSHRTPRPQSSRGCNSDSCKLPDCFCFGDSPSTIPLQEMPMFIMLTFDDALTTSLYNSYFQALSVSNDFKLFNPSGCRIKSTFYVSHENTDYSKVKIIWEAGNEIGSHTIHHELPQGDSDSDYPEMVAEIQGLKEEILKATRNKTLVDSILGFRAPYLRVAGNVQYNVLRDFDFLYDTSILNINILQNKKPHWPFTLDHVIRECVNPPCPTKSYPGLWEVPLNGWIGDDKEGCSMVDACVVGESSWSATKEEWYSFYKRNFEDYFYPDKVPMPIFTHGFLFANYPNSFPAMASWFQDLLHSQNNVWLVTPTQVIEWMKNPLSNKEMIARKWGC